MFEGYIRYHEDETRIASFNSPVRCVWCVCFWPVFIFLRAVEAECLFSATLIFLLFYFYLLIRGVEYVYVDWSWSCQRMPYCIHHMYMAGTPSESSHVLLSWICVWKPSRILHKRTVETPCECDGVLLRRICVKTTYCICHRCVEVTPYECAHVLISWIFVWKTRCILYMCVAVIPNVCADVPLSWTHQHTNNSSIISLAVDQTDRHTVILKTGDPVREMPQ